MQCPLSTPPYANDCRLSVIVLYNIHVAKPAAGYQETVRTLPPGAVQRQGMFTTRKPVCYVREERSRAQNSDHGNRGV